MTKTAQKVTKTGRFQGNRPDSPNLTSFPKTVKSDPDHLKTCKTALPRISEYFGLEFYIVKWPQKRTFVRPLYIKLVYNIVNYKKNQPNSLNGWPIRNRVLVFATEKDKHLCGF